jgi:hypothetical protein
MTNALDKSEKTISDKTGKSPATINVLTALTNNQDGSITVTLTINKGTASKILWVCLVVLAVILVFLGANLQALRGFSTERRLTAAALDDKRLENRAAWRQLGVDDIALEDHDISDILKEVRKKHPPKQE